MQDEPSPERQHCDPLRSLREGWAQVEPPSPGAPTATIDRRFTLPAARQPWPGVAAPIRDTTPKFTASFDNVFASIGAATVLTPVGSPKANAFAERWVRNVREDCLDHLFVLSRRHLERVLAECCRHYNNARPHRSLDLTAPRPVAVLGDVKAIRRLDLIGGILHEYELAA